MKFYTSVSVRGNNILYRGIEDGKRQVAKIPFKPTLYVRSQKKKTEWKSLYGDNVEPVVQDDIRAAKEFFESYKDVHNFPIFGNNNFEYQYICENYPGDITYNFSQFRIVTIDIETELPPAGAASNFPSITEADCAVNLITLLDHHANEAITFGCFDWKDQSSLWNADKVDRNMKVTYVKCDNEKHLLQRFMSHWVVDCPDMYTGWNTETFDTPYLINRIIKILGEEEAKKLSPFGILKDKYLKIFDKDVKTFEIVGVVELDYLALYKKFTYGNQESYSLDHISGEELGTGKLKFGCTFREAYTNPENHSAFISYNIVDCIRVKQLDDKLQFIQLSVIMAYMMKCNIKDVFGTVRPWDCMIHGYLYDKKIAIPQKRNVDAFSIEGGFVKDPVPGLYGWTMSFDFASLYPSIIRQWNISPETMLNQSIEMKKENIIDNNVPGSIETFTGCCIAANGSLYRQDKQGVIPYLMEYMMTERKVVKKKMLALEQQYQKTHDESLLSEIAMLNGRQMAYKISANSCFGAMAQPGFRYFEPRMAEAITLTGQASNIHLGNAFNDYLNALFKTDKDYVITADTDSNYLDVDAFVQKFAKDKSQDEIVKFLDSVGNKLQDVIDKSCEDIRVMTGCTAKVLSAKREAIASKALFSKKKRYAMVVHNSEGVDYSPYKLKIMGLDLVKSSTPKAIREDLKTVLTDIFFTNEEKVQDKIASLKKHFMKLDVNEIAFPRTANDIDKWVAGSGFRLGTPIHVRGSIVYNNFTEKNRDKYPMLRNGEKIKFIYLSMPNPIKSDAVAWSAEGEIPTELVKYVDYDKMWEKTFIAPAMTLLEPIGWKPETSSSLEDFF